MGVQHVEGETASARAGGSGLVGRDQLWVVLAVAAALTPFARLHVSWAMASAYAPFLGALATLGYVGLLGCVLGAAVVHTRRGRLLVDLATLGLIVGVRLLEVPWLAARGPKGMVDEGQLTHAATRVLIDGGDPYAASLGEHITHATRLMDGSIADHYDYPPFPLLLGWLGSHVWYGLADIAVLDVLALCLAAIAAFALLPRELRPCATLAILSIGFLDARARIGEPIVLALPLLILATAQWTHVGEPGRRRLPDVLAGICLGLAAATQQLVWFLVPFLFLALWCLRRGETSGGRALVRMLPYVASSGLVLLLVNLPFALHNPAAWWDGITGVLGQHAVPAGPGLPSLSTNWLHGSGGLDSFRLAAGLAFVGLLVVVALFPGRAAASFAILPMLSFLLSLRSQDTYYLAFAPLWLFLAAITPAGALDRARGLWRRRSRGLRLGIVGAAFVPMAVAIAVGLLAPAPLSVQAEVTQRAGPRALVVAVRNRDDRTMTPHFKLLFDGKSTAFLTVQTGPESVPAHQSAQYLLTMPPGYPAPRAGWRMLVLTDRPQTASVDTLTWLGRQPALSGAAIGHRLAPAARACWCGWAGS